MKRFFIILSVLSMILIYFAFPVSALPIDPDDFYIPPDLTPIELRDIFETTTVINSLGDTETDISIFPQRYYFQLWQTRLDSGKWLDYIGAFKNEFPKFEYDSLAGRVRPFGNSELNIGSQSGDIVNGYYYPYSRLEYISQINFTFGFNIQDLDHTANMLPPEEDLKGYFYLFDVASFALPYDPDNGEEPQYELRIVNKRGYPITYSYSYDYQTYTASFRCSLDVKFDLYSTGGNIVGFIPFFTFYQLDLSSLLSSKLFFPTFQMTSKYFYQQRLLADLNSFQQGSANLIDKNNLSSKVDTVVDNLDSFALSQFDEIGAAQVDASKAISSNLESILSLSAIFTLFFHIEFFNDIVIVSLSLGVIAVILNVVVSSAGAVGSYVRRDHNRKKE